MDSIVPFVCMERSLCSSWRGIYVTRKCHHCIFSASTTPVRARRVLIFTFWRRRLLFRHVNVWGAKGGESGDVWICVELLWFQIYRGLISAETSCQTRSAFYAWARHLTVKRIISVFNKLKRVTLLECLSKLWCNWRALATAYGRWRIQKRPQKS